MNNCIFCKIVRGEVPCTRVTETEHFLSFYDINPQASVHVLVIPKQHVENLNEAANKMDAQMLGLYLQEIAKIAEQLKITKSGYRTVFNTNKDACQTVFHVHAHIIGGEPLSGNMG